MWVRVVVAMVLLLLPTALQAQEKRIALLIGNRTYDASVGVLKNPHNDIAVVGEALTKQGFDVLPPIKDARRSAILGGVRGLVRRFNTAGAGANDPVFRSRKGGSLTERAVSGMVKRTAAKAGINEAVSPHWSRHAHGSHAIDRGASLPEVQTTLGHGNIATTSGYLHARPDTSSGLKLDPGVFHR